MAEEVNDQFPRAKAAAKSLAEKLHARYGPRIAQLEAENTALRDANDALADEIDVYKAFLLTASQLHPDLMPTFRHINDEALRMTQD
jgi:hypothetical protein